MPACQSECNSNVAVGDWLESAQALSGYITLAEQDRADRRHPVLPFARCIYHFEHDLVLTRQGSIRLNAI